MSNEHCRLSICSIFGWAWQIQNLRRAGLSKRNYLQKFSVSLNQIQLGFKRDLIIFWTQPPNWVTSYLKSRNKKQVIKFWLFGLFAYLQIECHVHSSESDHRFHLSEPYPIRLNATGKYLSASNLHITHHKMTFCKEFAGTHTLNDAPI